MNIVFDYDGVLANTWDSTVKSYMSINNLSDRIEAENELKNNTLTTYKNNDKIIYKRGKTNQTLEYNLRDYNLKQQMPQMYFNQFIEKLKSLPQNSRVAILSSANQLTLDNFIENCEIEFTHVIGYKEGSSLENQLNKIMEEWNVNPDEVYYLTDNINNIKEIQKVIPDYNILGTSWGYQGYSYLRTVLNDNNILMNPSELHSKTGLSENNDLIITEQTLEKLNDDIIKVSKNGIISLIIKTPNGIITSFDNTHKFNQFPFATINNSNTIIEVIESILDNYGISDFKINSLLRVFDELRKGESNRELLFEVETNQKLDNNITLLDKTKEESILSTIILSTVNYI